MAQLDALHPQTREKVEAWLQDCQHQGMDVRVYSTYRSFAEQRALYARFQAGGPTAAAPGHSFHNVRRAVDFFCYRNGQQIEDGGDPEYQKAGELGEDRGLKWGGRWQHRPDFDHLEDEHCSEHGEVGPHAPMHFNEAGDCQVEA